MSKQHRGWWVGVVLAALVIVGLGGVVGAARSASDALPVSEWWLVLHDQCADTLRWINSAGEFTSLPRPQLPDEAAGAACSYRAMHISQDGRYLVQSALLNTGRVGLGFYDMQTGQWLQVHEAQADEQIYLGARYSSDALNRIAIAFANAPTAARAWRVIVFDMTTGAALDELRSDGPEIAGFVGAEFLATAATLPHVLLLATDELTGAYHAEIRFDALTDGDAPFGAAAWYPAGAPGVVQELISSPYTATDIDLLPDRRAIYTYTEAAYPAGPPYGLAPYTVTTNAVGMLIPVDANDVSPTPQLFYADGSHTFYGAQWAADGRMVVFNTFDGASQTHYIRVGTAMLTALSDPVAQVIGVPSGFIYSTGDALYFMAETATAPQGPFYSDPILSGGAAFVWATAYGDPALALDTPTMPLATPSGSGPDLYVSEFALDPAIPVQGEAVTVHVGVYNQGNTAVSGSFQVDWYPGEVYSAPACNWTLDSMAAHGGQILTCTYAGYPSPYANINTMVRIDDLNTVIETDETNNIYLQPLSVSASSAPAAGQPDLFVSEFSLDPATPVQGAAVNVRVGVYNSGAAAATGSFDVLWYPGENYSSPACSWTVDGLVVNGGQILTCTYAGYPSSYATINTRVLIDTANVISESNESNNGYTLPVAVTAAASAGQPDLFVSEFALDPATPVQGAAVNVRVGVYNSGAAAATGSFDVLWYPGENYSSPACSWTVDGLAVNGGRVLTCTYAGYPSPYASINTKVLVDSGGAIVESSESNNSYTLPVAVTTAAPAGQPDLFVSEFALDPATPVQGQAVNVRVGVYNSGAAAATGSFTVVWYPGENYSSPACSWTVDGLVVNGGRVLTCTYAGYPSRYSSINTKVIVDSTGAIAESSEGNNSYTQSISVSAP